MRGVVSLGQVEVEVGDEWAFHEGVYGVREAWGRAATVYHTGRMLLRQVEVEVSCLD